jgi:hypothetical protein
MLFLTASVAWLSASTCVLAACRAAAFGDVQLAVEGEQTATEAQAIPPCV